MEDMVTYYLQYLDLATVAVTVFFLTVAIISNKLP